MSFLTVNGYAVPVRDGTVRRKVTKLGRRERSMRGALRDARRGQRREWAFDIPCATQEDADALRAMFEGRGHVVDFADGLQASTGLVAQPGTVRFRANAWGAFGRGLLQLAAATTGTVLTYPAQLPTTAWTVIWWAWNTSTGTWDGYAKRRDGVGYKNGVADNTVLEAGASLGVYPLATSTGDLEVVKDGASLVQLDDLCVLPYKATTGQLAAWTTFASGKFGPAPVLRLGGDAVNGATVWAMGEVQSADFMQAGGLSPSGWHSNAKVLHVTLREVNTPSGYTSTPTPPGSPLWWFDASDVDGSHNATLSHAGLVGTWVDKGSRGTNASAPVLGARPTLQLIGEAGRVNDSPSLLFDGTTDVMFTLAGAATADHPTWGVVFRADAAASARPLVDSLAGANKVQVAAGPVLTATQGATLTASNAPVVGTWSSVLANLDGAASTIRFNGTDTAGTTGALAQTTGVTIGANAALTAAFSGHIVEVVGWDGDVDADDWDAYVKAKYGTVPVT
jgi:hypothetical protein